MGSLFTGTSGRDRSDADLIPEHCRIHSSRSQCPFFRMCTLRGDWDCPGSGGAALRRRRCASGNHQFHRLQVWLVLAWCHLSYWCTIFTHMRINNLNYSTLTARGRDGSSGSWRFRRLNEKDGCFHHHKKALRIAGGTSAAGYDCDETNLDDDLIIPSEDNRTVMNVTADRFGGEAAVPLVPAL